MSETVQDRAMVTIKRYKDGLRTCFSCLHEKAAEQQRFTVLEIWQLLAWASGTATHYAAIHCPR